MLYNNQGVLFQQFIQNTCCIKKSVATFEESMVHYTNDFCEKNSRGTRQYYFHFAGINVTI